MFSKTISLFKNYLLNTYLKLDTIQLNKTDKNLCSFIAISLVADGNRQ